MKFETLSTPAKDSLIKAYPIFGRLDEVQVSYLLRDHRLYSCVQFIVNFFYNFVNLNKNKYKNFRSRRKVR